MPVPKTINKGQTVEIRCRILTEQKYQDEVYKIRCFQFEGKGTLQLKEQNPFLPNDLYTLPSKSFDYIILHSLWNLKILIFEYQTAQGQNKN